MKSGVTPPAAYCTAFGCDLVFTYYSDLAVTFQVLFQKKYAFYKWFTNGADLSAPEESSMGILTVFVPKIRQKICIYVREKMEYTEIRNIQDIYRMVMQ